MSSQCEHTDNQTDMSMDTNDLPDGNAFDFSRLNYEEERKKSFDTWPVHYPVDPARLAKAGFYYSGTGDEVICFSCQGHVKNWNYGDIVLKKHSDLYPDCDFIKNMSNNVPFTKSVFESNLQPCSIKKCTDAGQLSCEIDYEKMKSENERMKSFTERWPLTNVNIADLAHAGYFYTGIGDKVQCAFCKVIVGNLKVSNATPGEYLKHFPWCDHLNDKSSNFTPKAKNKTPWYHTSSEDVCGNMKPIQLRSDKTPVTKKLITKNQQQVNLEDLGVYLHKNPVHPHYASLLARLGTFSSWSPDAPVSKEELAAAGFFYLGTDDRTVCFHCNGGLKKWEAGDDPWIEHARWFSGCDFVRLNKGSDFIITCLLKSTSTILNENREVLNQPDTSESLLKKLDEAMESNLVRNLAEAGIFPPYILRAAILLQIKHTGSSFSNYDDLCMAASYLKEKMEEQYFNEKPVQAEDLNICLKISKNCTLSDTADETNQTKQTTHSLDTSDEKNTIKGESLITGNVIPTEKPNKQLSEKEDHYLCQICMDNELGVVFLPCGHLPACTTCAPALKNCPLCRKEIQATVRCFFH